MSAHVDPARFADASGIDRRAMLGHLRTCAACRAAAADHDPSLLFALLADTPIPERILDEVSRGVSRNAGRDRAPWGSLDPAAPWLRRGAAAAVVTLALASGYLAMREGSAPPAVAVHVPATEIPARPAAPRADVDVGSVGSVSQVVDFTVGDTQVVMVYNGDLRL